MNSNQKFIFITGAASGMGLATARLFAKNGWFVGIVDVHMQGLETLASEIGADHCHVAKLDVTDRAAYQKVLQDFSHKTGGRLDLLFNNAGIMKETVMFGDMDFAVIEEIIQINLMGVLNGIHSAYEMLKRTPNSLCFSTSSSSAIIGVPEYPVYSATKHAVKGLTESLSGQFSLVDIRAADTLPGFIKTGMIPDEADKYMSQEGMWRVMPAEAVADVVWASYHDKTGKLHWYVPDELAVRAKGVGVDVEDMRNRIRKDFIKRVKILSPNGDK